MNQCTKPTLLRLSPSNKPLHRPARCRQVNLLDVNGKDPALCLRAANLLGLLVRHAATISPGLAAAGACEALAAAIRQAGRG